MFGKKQAKDTEKHKLQTLQNTTKMTSTISTTTLNIKGASFENWLAILKIGENDALKQELVNLVEGLLLKLSCLCSWI